MATTTPKKKAVSKKTATVKVAKVVRKRAPVRDNTFLGMEKPNSLGANIGSFIGHGAQQLVKHLTGFGDYQIDKNSILNGGMSPPAIVNAVNHGGFIVRHREYIADLPASTAFVNTIYNINPGLNGTFPYLSQIAKAFELYRMRGLVFEFKSTSSDAVLSASASTALGVVAMATQYNSLNPGFTNMIALQNHEFASTSKPSCDFYHPVECKKSLLPASELYIRTGSTGLGDLRLYDLGQFNIATSGMQNATGVVGQLWATYEVEFYQARYDAPTGILSDHVYSVTCTNTNWMGTTHSFRSGNSIGIGLTGNTIVFPPNIRDGSYMFIMKYKLTGANSAINAPTLVLGPTAGSGNLLQLWSNDTALNGNSVDGIVTATFHLSYVVQVLQQGLTLTFSAGTLADAVCDLFVTQLDADIVA